MSSQKEPNLYYHSVGPEKGSVEMVDESCELVKLICSSEKKSDHGVIFTVYTDHSLYKEMCKDYKLETIEGCIIESFDDQINIKYVPNETPLPIPKPKIKNGKVHTLLTSKLYKHPWGRCCCVHHEKNLEPVITERLLEEELSWWPSNLTPFQLDLLACGNDPDENAMHVLLDDNHICDRCGHYAWVVLDEDMPEELPSSIEHICPERSILDDVVWESKTDAWISFKEDPNNAAIIEKSGLPIARTSNKQKKRFKNHFKKINNLPGVEKSIYNIKQAFFFALGPNPEGTWADLDLEALRSIKSLKKLEIPVEILNLNEESIDENSVEYELDEEVNHLKYIIDEEDLSLDDEINDIPEVIEPKTQKSQKVQKPIPIRPENNKKSKKAIIEAAQALQNALAAFIEAIGEEG
jgi:hypothetical protein